MVPIVEAVVEVLFMVRTAALKLLFKFQMTIFELICVVTG